MQATPRAVYDPFSQALHWITAIVVIAAFTLGPEGFGQLMQQGVDPATRPSIVWHESLGMLVLVLTLVRVVWVALRPGAPRSAMAAWMHGLSKLLQGVMWMLLLALPCTALLALGGEDHPLTLLGGFRVDHMPWIANARVAHAVDWGDAHGFLGDTLIWLAGLHAAAAIVHHVVLKDGVLLSMLPSRTKSE